MKSDTDDTSDSDESYVQRCMYCNCECVTDYCEDCTVRINSIPHNLVTCKKMHFIVVCCQYGTVHDDGCCRKKTEMCILCDYNITPSEYYDALKKKDDYRAVLLDFVGKDNEYPYYYCDWCI